MKSPTPSTVYCIFYIDREYYTTLNEELSDKGYGKIKAIVPTVRILRKIVHGTKVYEDIPLLFNYAFMKIPRELAYSRGFMRKLKDDIRGIRGWLKSPESLHPKKKKKRVDNMDIFDDFSLVATATKKEVRYFQRLSRKNKRYSFKDIMKIKVGDYLVLKSYPYDGIDATIEDINYKTNMITLMLYPTLGKMKVTLTFDQVLDSVYSNYDPELITMGNDIDMSTITEEAINQVLSLKQL